jgi:hypothetical protein
MGALDELGSRGLIDWTRTVVDGLGRRRCHGQLRYQLWWLARLTWSVLLGVCWWSYGAGWFWMNAATVPAPQATTWTKAELAFTRQVTVYGYDRRVCGCVTNCVTITTDDNGLPGILGDA